MNAGAYGSEVSEVVEYVEVITQMGNSKHTTNRFQLS